MKLLPFQVSAAAQMADRYAKYMLDPLMVTRSQIVPFYQTLSAITGSGKTLILADFIEQVRSRLPIEPIVLWLSKGRVVVLQTLHNLSVGKYAELIAGYAVKALSDCRETDIIDSSRGLVLVATDAKFNQKDREDGDRKIFKVQLDVENKSLWTMIKQRKDSSGNRRQLIVVYDEGQNLSQQKTTLLMDLSPDAIVSASATPALSGELSDIIARIKKDKGWLDGDFVTAVPSGEVVKSALIKREILLCGYLTPMEMAIDDLLADYRAACASATDIRAKFTPKAIYVSSTNTVDQVPIRVDIARPFEERQARPILIWRHLVKRGINPEDIAVYCNLEFDKKFPPPKNFVLYSGGDQDYGRFTSASHRHIIFNLSLQEGWDDPECCFAYIDKDMGSVSQISQVIGRVIRQPNGKHYADSRLNTAHYYIRTDEKGLFEDVLNDIRKNIAIASPEIVISVRSGGGGKRRGILPPRKNKKIPIVSINSQDAILPIRETIENIIDFSQRKKESIGKGGRIQVLRAIGVDSNGSEEWVEVEHSNRVTARWIFVREVQRSHGDAINLCDIEDKKFDALIEWNSPASAHIIKSAQDVVQKYVEHSVIVQNPLEDPISIGSINIDANTFHRFKNSIHEGYSGLNKLELSFAKAIDRTKKIWFRNPSYGGFGIPLLDKGKTNSFHPDFIVWTSGKIIAIDTKGGHLLVEESRRKLFNIDQLGKCDRLVTVFVAAGKWTVGSNNVDVIQSKSVGGFSLLSQKMGKLKSAHFSTIDECAAAVVSY